MTLLHREPPGRFEKACYASCGVSAVIFAVAVARWAMPLPAPDPAPASSGAATLDLGARRSAAASSALRVVATDPFHVARTAPQARYLLPETEDRATASNPGSWVRFDSSGRPSSAAEADS
jgi:hypothetical protein